MNPNKLRFQPDPELDLVLERIIDVPPDLVWRAWTEPEHLKNWFAPRPWMTTECEIDLRPGGSFKTVMRSPEGEDYPGHGCILEVVPGAKLVFTDALAGGYRPNREPFMTAMLLLEPSGQGTKYTAIAIHATEENRKKHEEMGFHSGWGTALDQLIEHVKTF